MRPFRWIPDAPPLAYRAIGCVRSNGTWDAAWWQGVLLSAHKAKRLPRWLRVLPIAPHER